MRWPQVRRLLMGLCGLYAAMLVAIVALLVSDRANVGEAGFAFATVGWIVAGALIASRRPANPVGWIVLATGLVVSTQALAQGYAEGADIDDPAWALELSVWVSHWIFYVWLVLAAILLPLLFPDGRLPSRRWRWVGRLAACALVVSVCAAALKPGRVDENAVRPVDNPVGVVGADGVLGVAEAIGTALALVSFVAAAGAVVVRLRRTRGAERQQVKWFAWVAALMLTGLVLATASLPFEGSRWQPADVVGAVGWLTALGLLTFGVPLATGIAILRHRLYDIDVVVNRTLVYGALTAMLLASYLGLVLLLQLALSPLTERSDLAIAGSTLAVAALFRPARARIQHAVDRRFYRRKYDAARTLESFGARLRDEVDLDALNAELRGVVRDTMQPAHVSLWLRAPEASR